MSRPLLVASEVEMRYGDNASPAITGANIVLAPGSSLGLVGESGSGKTTLARALVGALEPTGGVVTVKGRAWSDVGRRDPLRRSVQMIFQDPYASLNPNQTPRQTVAEVFQVWDRQSRRTASTSAAKLLAEIGMYGDLIDRLPVSLSGGQQQRVGIARALACNPAVLVADEPTASLDVSVQAQILNLLGDLRETRDLALVLVSHDLAVVRHMVSDTCVVYGGRIVEQGPTAQLFDAPRHPYTQVLIDSIPEHGGQLRLVRNDSVGTDACPFAPRCARVTSRCTREVPPLVGQEHRVACYHPVNGDATRLPDRRDES